MSMFPPLPFALGLFLSACKAVEGGRSFLSASQRKSGASTSSARTGLSVALAALALSVSTPMATAQTMTDGQTPQPAIAADNYPYQLFLPPGYNADSKAKWPLLIFLHRTGITEERRVGKR